MIQRVLGLVLPAALVVPVLVGAVTPEPQEIVERMIETAGGSAAFSKLGVLELEVSEEETRNDGTSTKSSYKVFVDTADLGNARIERSDGVTLGRTKSGGWATVNGEIDERPQTSHMANGAINQSLFPQLLPFSLTMDGVWVKAVTEATVEGREAWVLEVPFSKGFFVSAVMTTTWHVVVAKDDYSLIALSFLPPPEYRKVQTKGIRYRILKTTELDGVQIPAQLLLIGINLKGQESGHVRVTKIEASVRGPWEPALFLDPKRLEELEGLEEE